MDANIPTFEHAVCHICGEPVLALHGFLATHLDGRNLRVLSDVLRCDGSGEPVECRKAMDNWPPCPSCRGTGRNDHYNPHTKRTERVKCLLCRGSGQRPADLAAEESRVERESSERYDREKAQADAS